MHWRRYAFAWNLGIDELLVADRSAMDPHPGRIPWIGGVKFLLLGAALALLDVRSTGNRWPAQWLALAVASISFVVILGYAYDVSSLYRPSSSSLIALHGALNPSGMPLKSASRPTFTSSMRFPTTTAGIAVAKRRWKSTTSVSSHEA